MIILNAGVPRSGTVLVNAIVRQLCCQNGVATLQANPHGRELPALIRRLRRTGIDRHKAVLVHTHSWDAETSRLMVDQPNVTAFLNFRDPRDVSVSLIRLHETTFDTTLKAVEGYFAVLEAMALDLDPMVVPYELLVDAKPAHIFQIARRLGFWPTLQQVAAVDEATSLDHHRKVMEDVQAGNMDGLNRHRVLVEDVRTLINDHHIQSGASGRWRGELTEDQQKTINERFAPLLQRYGYDA